MTEQELFERILTSVSLEHLVNTLSTEMCQFLDAERITIYQKGLADNEIVSRFKTGGDLIEIRVPLSTSSIAGYVALSQHPLFFKDVYISEDLKKIHKDLAFDSSFDKKSGFRTKAMIVVPVKSNNVLLGVLQVLNKVNGEEFSPKEANRALKLARIIGEKFSKDLQATRSPYEYLVQRGLINQKDLSILEAKAIKRRVHPSHLLMEEYKVQPEVIGKSLELFYQVPYQPYDSAIIPPAELLAKANSSYMRKQLCVPILGDEQEATIVIDDPSDCARILEIQRALGIKKFIVRVSLPSEIRRFLIGEAKFNSGADLTEILDEMQDDAELIDDDAPTDESDVDSNAAPVIKLVNRLIVDAVQMGASDIHIEPGKEKTPTIVRMRIDGVCREIERIPAKYGPPVLSRVKIMSRLDIAERRLPQDGKCKLKFGGKMVELRVATLPTVNGESAVLRVLAGAGALPIDKLNLSEKNMARLLELVKHPHGILLVVGPTGSGKTTTLHAVLGHLNTPDKKIWTAEDPVEITQPGLQQVQVQPKIGFDFAAAMRSFLRADPDIILIGEMRDRETSHVGVEASLTGHLVLSTLHTNSAPETITRLLDLGLDPVNFADALLGVLAQRLMRTLCAHCKQAYHPDDKEISKLKHMYGEQFFPELDLKQIKQHVIASTSKEKLKELDLKSEKMILMKAQGCEKCDKTGYRGRTGIHELLVATATMKSTISKGATVTELKNLAVKEGMRMLSQDGVLKIMMGLSDLNQLHRVVAED